MENLTILEQESLLSTRSTVPLVYYPFTGIFKPVDYSQKVCEISRDEDPFRDIKSIECGGSGDCFFRCIETLNKLYKMNGFEMLCLTVEDSYRALNIPHGTWIEDTHINIFATSTFCKIHVVSHVAHKPYLSTFGVSGPCYYLLNLGNYHYRALIGPQIYQHLDEIKNVGLTIDSQRRVIEQSYLIPEIVDQTNREDTDNAPEWESEDELPKSGSSDESEAESIMFSVLPPSCDPKTLFSYLRDFGSMRIDSCVEVLDAFYIVHHSILDWLSENLNHNLVSHPYMLKLYYKARHNTFGFLCTSSLGMRAIETDQSLSKYIESNRTPDMIIENEKSIVLLEYTVSNKYDMVDFNKGGGLIDTKYSDEAREIGMKTGKSCSVCIVPAVLDEFNIEEIVDIMEPYSVVDKELMTRFFSICNQHKSIISNAYFSGFNSSTGIKAAAGLNEIPKLNNTEMLDGHFVSLMLKNWDWLLSYVTSMIDKKGPEFRVAFCYEKTTGRISMIESAKKMKTVKLAECMDMLSEGDLSRVLSSMNYRMDGKRVGTKEMKGDVAITTKSQGKSFTKKPWSYSTTTQDIYTRTVPETPDPYGEFDTLPGPEFVPPKAKVLFDDLYFNRLMNHDFNDLKVSRCSKLLANNTIDANYLSNSVNTFLTEYKLKNTASDIILNPKQSFILPMVTVPCTNTNLDDMSLDVVNAYLSSGKGKYTQALLAKALKGEFFDEAVQSEDISKARVNYSDSRLAYTSEYTNTSKGVYRKWSAMPEENKIKLRTPRSAMIKAQQVYIGLLRKAKRKKMRTVKLNCGKNSIMKREFKQEMIHFSRENKGMKGVGEIRNFELLDNFFKGLIDNMTRTGFQTLEVPPLYNTERGPGPELLTKDKDFYTGRWNSFYKEKFSGTLLEQLSIIGSNFSKLLFNESVKSYNQNFCKVDNLGFKQIIVLVRGGKKSYSNNMSKLYRVGFQCLESDITYFGYEENKFFEIVRDNGKCFVFSPWSQIHIDTLYDWFSMRHKIFMNCYSNHVREGSPETLSKLSIFPSVLSFHNRRKTESLLHNVRYLIVNPMGTYSNLNGIMKSFGTFNLSYFDAWLKECLKSRYLKFANTVHEISLANIGSMDRVLSEFDLKDLWFNEPFVNTDQLTSFIYVTYAMTKAPVNASLEQASNIKSILQDIKQFEDEHSDVQKMRDKSLHFDIFNFDPDVLDDDFKYDPVFCQYLGYHMAGFIKGRADPNEISGIWNRASNKGLSSIANSNGLRGFNESNFFGKKGYEVVYDYIIEKLESGDIELNKLVEEYLSLDPESAHEMIKTQMVHHNELTLDKITFHIVHKLQRGGGREIFCMDLVTKAYQNPLEQFFKGLCKLVPNEFISISSSKRHSIIHTDFFERTPAPWIKSTLRWVLDCRRWAPHSVFQKYMHFVHGMSPILPKSMVEHFEKFGDLMMEKRYITRQHVYGAIENNMAFKDLKGYLTPAPENGTYETEVKFSFVMGIFNYLSSLLHAANQLVASEIIMNNSLRSGTGLVIMDPKCHSDDSAITSYHEHEDSVRPSVLIYDWLMKGANHMLSIKKSQVNKNLYMEFLSILYIFDRYVPVIPKFLSSMPFKPTDRGYSADVTFAITQAIEILIQGGTIEESFLILKLTENHIQTIYNLTPNPDLPYNYLGNLDSHPLELLLAGANCEIFKFMKFKPVEFWAATNLLERFELIDSTSPTDLSIRWDMGSRMSNKLKIKYSKYTAVADELGKKYPWTLENCKLGNDYLNILWFVNKLNDPKYYSSMIHEPDSRRFTRAFGSFKYRTVIADDGKLMDVEKLSNMLATIDIYSPHVESSRVSELVEIFEFVCDDLMSFYQSIDSAVWTGEQLPQNYKDKPVYFNFSLPQLSSVRIDANEYISYTREPEAYKLLGKRTDPRRQVNMINDYCSSLGLDMVKYSDSQLYMIINKILNAGEHNFRLIAPVPSNTKKIDTFNTLLTYLSHNSIRYGKRPIISTSTSRVDWRRRVVSGRVPEVVLETLELQSILELAQNYEVEDEDIFLYSLKDKLGNLLSETPVSWRPLLYASISRHDVPLINEHYWVYWERDQVKSGRNWYGKGACVVSLPEAMLRITCNNGVVSEIEFESESKTNFNTTTNWFLGNMLRLSGMNLPLDLAQYQDPNKLVLGYNSKACTYGIDYPNRFDLVFPNPLITHEVSKSFMYVDCDREKVGRYWRYNDGNRIYKIEFFVPTVETPTIDITKFVDIDKVKGKISQDKIREFCFNISVELREEYTFKTQEVIDTIGFSTLYKVLYANPDFMNAFKGVSVQDVFLESIMDWRRKNKGFNFPSMEELEMMSKRSDLPQMPGKIVRYLHKIGLSTMSDEDYSNMISRLFSIPEDARVNYLLTIFPQMSDEERVQSIVISIRSDRLYECVSFIGRDVFKILNPLLMAIVDLVSSGTVISQMLTSLTTRFSGSSPDDEYTIRLIIARIILNGANSLEILSESDPTVGVFLSIVSELIDDGLLPSLEAITSTIPLLNSVKWVVEKQKFINFLIDLFDNLYISRYLKKPVFKRSEILRTDTPELSPHKKYIIKLLSWRMPESLNITLKTAKESRASYRLNLSKPVPGLASRYFQPLDEDDQMEFEDGYDWNPDIEEDLMFEGVGEAKSLAFVRVACGNWIGIQSVRGTAHTVLVGTNVLSRSFLQAHGDKTIYRRSKFSNILDYINNLGYYIVKVSESKKFIKIDGFKRMDYTEYFRSESIYKSTPVIINGKEYSKLDILSSPKLAREISNLDSYFKRISIKNTAREMEIQGKKDELLKEAGIKRSPEYYKMRKEIEQLVADDLKKHETKQPKEGTVDKEEIKGKPKSADSKPMESKPLSEVLDMQDLKDKLDKMVKHGDIITDMPNISRSTVAERNFNFKDPAKLLRDPSFIGEFNALFGNTWGMFERNELRLTALTKRTKLKYAKLQLKAMPPQMQSHYVKVYGVMACLFNDIETCQSPVHESHILSAAIDQLFDVQTEADDTADLRMFLEPSPGEIRKNPDLDRLFQKQ
ncbi:RNA-dependent RNA polymerase [Phytophthora condilina negative stranded RNA virus 11]|nr:RNA-dependent RNA polymerase [Phytophthora condilina negative stranded RNA virus 11]